MPTPPTAARHRFPVVAKLVPALLAALCLTGAPAEAADPYAFVRRFQDPHIPIPMTGDYDAFGSSVAALGADRVVVGAPYTDTVSGADAGAAYLFDATTGALLQTFTRPGATDHEYFGGQVATVGGNVLIGAYDANDLGYQSGAAYVFDPTTGAALLTLHNPRFGTEAGFGGDSFGVSVAAYGSDILVGATTEDLAAPDGGAVYLFDGSTGALLRTFVSPNPHANEYFGTAVAAFGTTVVVGAPESIGDSGGRVYELDGTTGALLHTLDPPAGPLVNQFGHKVALIGTNVLTADENAGATGPPHVVGAAALFDGPTGGLLRSFVNPGQQYFMSNFFGAGITGLGSDVFVSDTVGGADDRGAVFRFDAASGALLQTIDPPLPRSSQFGADLATIGNALLVGAPFDLESVGPSLVPRGSVYLFAPCGNGVQEYGQACDDGNLTDGDGCDSNCTVTACGNGVVTTGESCDDGNLVDTDCCSALCQTATVGTPCDDGNPNTTADQCNASGVCEGLPPGIPTLSEWGVLLLSLLMLARIIWLARRQRVPRRR